MKYLLTSSQMKKADQNTINGEQHIPSLTLMERAASGIARVISQRIRKGERILVVCGSGNNGGDGYGAARILLEKGYDVTTVSVGNEAHMTEETAQEYQRLLKKNRAVLHEIPDDSYACVLDAVFGIGLSRPVAGDYKTLIEKMNALSGYKVAADIASGISADTGEVLGCAFRADETVTVSNAKRGQFLFPGISYSGKITVIDIGIHGKRGETASYARMLRKKDVGRLLPKRPADSHKGTFGRVLVIAGSVNMTGAAYLCALAAYRSGAGLVMIYTPQENRVILQELLPEAILTTYPSGKGSGKNLSEAISWATQIAIGPGLGMSKDSEKMICQTLREAKVPLILDADGINQVALHPELLSSYDGVHLIMTPHLKEMERLSALKVSEIRKNPDAAVHPFLCKNRTIVLKDSRTWIFSTECSHPYLNVHGSSALAKGGSGDVLTGTILGLLGSGASAGDACRLGVLLHSLAGEELEKKRGSYGVLAREIADEIPLLMHKKGAD